MVSNSMYAVSMMACCAALPAFVGCASNAKCGEFTSACARKAGHEPSVRCNGSHKCGKCGKCKNGNGKVKATTAALPPARADLAGADLPPNASPGDCFGRVFIPPQYETRTEKVCVREATEKIEIVPAQYEWVEERVCVKDGYKELVTEPAEYESEERIVEVQPGRTEWVAVDDSAKCVTDKGQPAKDVLCLVSHPPVTRTVRTECLKKPACVKEVSVPPEYQTVRRQKMVAPATTRKVVIPAEYETIEKTVAVGPSRMEWQRVICPANATAELANTVKSALAAQGYDAGPMTGQFDDATWGALKNFQQRNGLGVGALTYETLDRLHVSAR